MRTETDWSDEDYRALVDVVDERLLRWRHPPRITPRSLEVMAAGAAALTADWADYVMLLDASDTARPDAECRARIARLYHQWTRLRHVVIFVGDSDVLEATARFVQRAMGRHNWSVHRDRDEALREALRVRDDA